MTTLEHILSGMSNLVFSEAIIYCIIGVTLGTFAGVLPGIGTLAAISLLLPITYHMDPASAIVMLAGVYYGAQYGGSTSSILLNIPGSPTAIVACLDGYPLSQKGRAGVALFITTVASFFGAAFGFFVLIMLSPVIARVGVRFGPQEYFAITLLGVLMVSAFASRSQLKGLIMVCFGLFLGTIGTDINTGVVRFNFGSVQLMDGVNLVALAIGLFGIAEVVRSSSIMTNKIRPEPVSLKSMIPTKDDWRRIFLPMVRGAGLGSFLGALPGTGSGAASFMAYGIEKQVSRNASEFGKGAVEGLAAPESANNAAAQTAFVPTLTLGIPGDSVMVLILSALILHGIQPGPLLIVQQEALFWSLIASFILGNIFLVILNIPMIGVWVSILRIPYHYLYPTILVFICIGVFSINNNVFDVMVAAFFGVLGYVLYNFRFEAAPILLGFILGPIMEESFRRSLMISRGNLYTFIDRPVSGFFLFIALCVIVVPLVRYLRRVIWS